MEGVESLLEASWLVSPTTRGRIQSVLMMVKYMIPHFHKSHSIIIVISMLNLLNLGCRGYVDKLGYYNGVVTIIVESTKEYYPQGKPIPVKVSVRNNHDKPFVFNTKGRPIRQTTPLVTPLGLSEPRPVYDLVVVKGGVGQPRGILDLVPEYRGTSAH